MFNVVTIEGVLEEIKSEKYKSLIDALPDSLVDENAYKLAKKKLPAWALNGEFSNKVANDCFIKSNGEFHFEIDKLDKKQVTAIKRAIATQCPYVYALWVSPSQRGLKGLIRVADDLISSDADFKQAFMQIEKALAALGFVIDTSCKDVRRLCFVCSDKDIYINEDAEAFNFDCSVWNDELVSLSNTYKSGLNQTTKSLMYSPTPETPREIARLESMLEFISADCSYEQYRNVVWALLSNDWDCAEQLALDWSMTEPDRFEETTFNELIRSHDDSITPTLGSIYHLARKGGWDG